MSNGQQGAGRSVMSIIALVLGVVAAVMSWMPIINNFAFAIGAIGLILGIIGLVGVLRGKKAGKALSIVALVVNVVALAIVLMTQSAYSAAIDKAANGPSATSTSAQQAADDGQDEGAAPAEDASYTDLAPGTSVVFENGLSVTVDSVETGLENYDGSTVVGVHVTYVNNGDESADYNPYDWKGEDANGAQEYNTYYDAAEDALNSGSLAAGGSVSGTIYFKEGTIKALYFASAIADEPAASWTLA